MPAKDHRSTGIRASGIAQPNAAVDERAYGPRPIYTIGHSTRTIPEFVALLKAGDVDLAVDVRSVPRSRTDPHYSLDVLPDELASWRIGHTRIPELGGLRSKSKTLLPEINGFWMSQSFHNYADDALASEFRTGLSRLLELSRDRRCAIMCSEAVWWRCHRRIVADYLLHGGRTVFHLMASARAEPATLTKAAMAKGDWLVYPAAWPSETPPQHRYELKERHDREPSQTGRT